MESILAVCCFAKQLPVLDTHLVERVCVAGDQARPMWSNKWQCPVSVPNKQTCRIYSRIPQCPLSLYCMPYKAAQNLSFWHQCWDIYQHNKTCTTFFVYMLAAGTTFVQEMKLWSRLLACVLPLFTHPSPRKLISQNKQPPSFQAQSISLSNITTKWNSKTAKHGGRLRFTHHRFVPCPLFDQTRLQSQPLMHFYFLPILFEKLACKISPWGKVFTSTRAFSIKAFFCKNH